MSDSSLESTDEKDSANDEVLIRMQATPNPQALKFVTSKPVKNEGKATFDSVESTYGNVLAYSLMDLEGVTQVHMFSNFMTITFADEIDPYEKIDEVVSVIKTRFPVHDPNFQVSGEKKKKDRSKLSPELLEIEEILDRTIRPGLQADGGDLEVLRLDGKYLEIRYEGACGTCPSATMGTLQAIESIMQQEYDPDLSVILG